MTPKIFLKLDQLVVKNLSIDQTYNKNKKNQNIFKKQLADLPFIDSHVSFRDKFTSQFE